MKLNGPCQEPQQGQSQPSVLPAGGASKNTASAQVAKDAPISLFSHYSHSPPGKQAGIMVKQMSSAARWPKFKPLLLACELEGETLHLSQWFEILELPFSVILAATLNSLVRLAGCLTCL